MQFEVKFSTRAVKEIGKLDSTTRLLLKNRLMKHLQHCENPRAFGKALNGNKNGLWRYRIGDYRLICLIEDEQCVILALTFGHHSEIYR